MDRSTKQGAAFVGGPAMALFLADVVRRANEFEILLALARQDDPQALRVFIRKYDEAPKDESHD